MKKLITLFAIVFVTTHVMSQVSLSTPAKDCPKDFKTVKFEKQLPLKNASKASNERWYNFGETMDLFYGGNSSELYGNNLFPDSTILVNYGTSGYSGPWIHMLGDVLDVKSSFFNELTLHPGELAMDKLSTYKVDSIGILCFYERNLIDPLVVDTLLIEVSVNNNLSSPYFANSGINTNLGSDTVYIHQIAYGQATNTLNLSTKKQYKFPLTEQFFGDSLDNGLHYIEISTDDLPIVNAGRFVVTALSFIPGYDWTPNVDTLISKNRFFFLSFKEQEDMFPIYVKRDFNISYVIPQDVRYNNAASWNGLFIPSFAYMSASASYKYEHHLIYYKTTCQTNCSEVGTTQLTNSTAPALGDAYPNPSMGNAVNIPLNISTAGSKLYIKNILGQTISSYNNLPIGQSEINISTIDLPVGIYLYTLENSSNQITKKLIINK